MKRYLSVLIAFVLVISCSSKPKPPEHLIVEDTYIDLLIELQLLKTYQATSKSDSTKIDSLMQGVLKKYEVTWQQFNKSNQYYQNQIKSQQERIDKAIERLRKDQLQKPDTTAVDSTSVNNKNQATNNKQS